MMEKKYEEKGANLASKVPASLAANFRRQAKERGQQVKYNLEAATRLWVSLPVEIQARLLDKSLSETAFIELINQVVDERIEAGRKAGQALVRHQKKMLDQEG